MIIDWLYDILKILIITVFAGLIFRSSISSHKEYSFWKSVLYAGAIVAPAIVLHELGHKFMALSFGLDATLQVPWFWLVIALALSLANFPVVFFVAAYVSISGDATSLQSALIALAGPFVNLLIYITVRILQKKYPHSFELAVMRKINGFLFVFNLLPIPGFDGYTALAHLLG